MRRRQEGRMLSLTSRAFVRRESSLPSECVGSYALLAKHKIKARERRPKRYSQKEEHQELRNKNDHHSLPIRTCRAVNDSSCQAMPVHMPNVRQIGGRRRDMRWIGGTRKKAPGGANPRVPWAALRQDNEAPMAVSRGPEGYGESLGRQGARVEKRDPIPPPHHTCGSLPIAARG